MFPGIPNETQEAFILKLDGMSSLNCLTCKPTLNKRVRKAKSEEEFLAGLQKDPQFKAQNLAVDPTT